MESEKGTNGTSTYSQPTYSQPTGTYVVPVENKIESWTKTILAIFVVSGAMIGGVLAMVYNMPVPSIITGFAGIIIGYYFGSMTK